MYKTKSAWKVVSDPYAPESQWAPACAETVSGEDPFYAFQAFRERKARSASRKGVEAILLSSAVAVLGGAFAGQCVHALYYAQHLFGQFFYNDSLFVPWGSFYYWFNQQNATCTYVPILFAYSMGFLSRINEFGKKFGFVSACILALYLVTIGSVQDFALLVDEQVSYSSMLLGSGVVGSVAAFFLGKTIAKNVATIISPRLIFIAMLSTFLSMFVLIPPLMSNFAFVAILCMLAVMVLGFSIRCMHSGSLKTSILLSVTAASPLVLCGVMHFPMAGWFGNVFSESYGSGASLTKDVFYYLLLPGLALGLPVIGTVIAHSLGAVAHGEQSTSQLTSAEPSLPVSGMQSIEET